MPLTLRATGLDLFGRASPRLLILRIETNDALLDLLRQVQSAIRNAGIERKRERFRPHITLARFRHGMPPADTARLQQFLATHGATDFAGFSPTSFSLFASVLHPTGAVHDVLASYDLNTF